MSIFSMIRDAIWHKRKAAPQPAPAAAQNAPRPQPQPPHPQAQAPAPQPAAQVQPIDIEAHLEELARHGGQQLDWRHSIVDLMKLVGIDPSLHNREDLARELGYGGALGGSAEMNIWLHKAVMRELEKSGGKVPAALLD
ncbi:MAG: DUF3597 domain-containing protein [Sphingomonas sp.]|uniref:DUF3597 domain-containing protein n=1 Tax=Sphingomonas sp. TaxID=28214 RepID=UPI0025DD6644|nr:DUF3597 domain-containing protein [Sphingomonas sp.]MBX9880498.1 DUF3597 domain-containing protein [Sphingomonas sp.]